MFDRVKNMIAEQLYLSADDVKEDSRFVDDLGADSLDVVQMLIAMEKEFGITFDDDEIADIKTVKDAIDLIEKKKK